MDAKTLPHDDLTYEQAKEDLKSSAASISTTSTAVDAALGTFDEEVFLPGRSLFIDSRGIGLIRLPIPPAELEIPIHSSDGFVTYTSTREKRSSGDATLSCPKLGSLVTTSYFFGPSRDPVIQLLQSASGPQDIKISGKWTSRSQAFSTPDGSEYEWHYVRQPGKKSYCGSEKTLVLEKKSGASNSSRQRLAELVRNENTRPDRTNRTRAGYGGELVVDKDATLELDEALIVATCLLMLKKEVDRRRLIQLMAICGGGGGGGGS